MLLVSSVMRKFFFIIFFCQCAWFYAHGFFCCAEVFVPRLLQARRFESGGTHEMKT